MTDSARMTAPRSGRAGGKGVNISRGIDCRPVETQGALRVNIMINEPDGTTTKLNSPGPTVTPEVLAELTASLRTRTATADRVVPAGSLPPGAPARWYAELVAVLREAGGPPPSPTPS